MASVGDRRLWPWPALATARVERGVGRGVVGWPVTKAAQAHGRYPGYLFVYFSAGGSSSGGVVASRKGAVVRWSRRRTRPGHQLDTGHPSVGLRGHTSAAVIATRSAVVRGGQHIDGPQARLAGVWPHRASHPHLGVWPGEVMAAWPRPRLNWPILLDWPAAARPRLVAGRRPLRHGTLPSAPCRPPSIGAFSASWRHHYANSASARTARSSAVTSSPSHPIRSSRGT
jgi:hypothetical protein